MSEKNHTLLPFLPNSGSLPNKLEMVTPPEESPISLNKQFDEVRRILFIKNNYKYDATTGNLYWKYLTGNRKSDSVGWISGAGHLQVWAGTKQVAATYAIWILMTGHPPLGVVDHINGNKIHNKWENLRDVTPQENGMNKRARYRRKNKYLPANIEQIPSGSYRVCLQAFGKKYNSKCVWSLEEALKIRASMYNELGFHPNHGR